ncbi:MAG: hypothetical protein A2381_08945 [Bdellovibrionales bacterium RIFOXYB1_FULL_37_110]|nr:MAG: hypothetical protein A2181_09140 [Bdellovibrionales bacterium RIFOXYA1_FULL_38_20]OFZ50355.1 MAG: hypothetical protein A2417_09045 [Bdellovibrionales bacterium RIFOXYC1_FULL_37_79]OFZ60964.1 MAG: hypothetical protein A2381_08945 [Bdellovibrionales bacterium RIFOXYB1_FULL_37_110]OFZ63708.1 MAG: hypothetical protein A2577_08065 [Bdellovibrionales bacterium RIFOXYD1_FULL_36_51]
MTIDNDVSLDQFVLLQTGEIAIDGGDFIINSGPLGSCIAVIIVDPCNLIGGIAHVMLPGTNKNTLPESDYRYAEGAIAALIDKLTVCGSLKKDMKAFAIGAGNVLKSPDDIICLPIINSVNTCLRNLSIPIEKTALGGHDRKSAILDIQNKQIRYTVGDSSEKVFYEF